MTLAVLLLLWLAVVLFLRAYRVWLFYYIVGVVGFAYFLILGAGNHLGLEVRLAHSVALAVHAIATPSGIPTRIFTNAPGILLVLVVVQEVGWTVLQIGVESSGLLEIAVLTSLMLFYPGWSRQRRALTILLGVAATWAANVIRMLFIVVILHSFGKESLLLAHTYAGKALFFLLTVMIYWYLVTSPTLGGLERPAQERQQAI